MKLDIMMRILKVLLKIGPSPGDMGDDPLVLVIQHLLPLLVALVFVAQHPPTIVDLLKVAPITAKLQHVLVFECSHLGDGDAANVRGCRRWHDRSIRGWQLIEQDRWCRPKARCNRQTTSQ